MRFREAGRGLLDGRVAIVSGVGTGLGRSIATTLAAEGAKVVLAARNTARLDEIAEEITGAGGNALTVPTDVSRPDDCARLVQATTDAFGRLDVVVNNGHHQGDFTLLEDSDVGGWDAVFAVNVFGPMRIIQHAVPIMKGQGDGRIVNVNSGAVISSKPTLGAYSASKAGLASIDEDPRPRTRAFRDPRQRDVRELDVRRQREGLGPPRGGGGRHLLRRMVHPQERSRVRDRQRCRCPTRSQALHCSSPPTCRVRSPDRSSA